METFSLDEPKDGDNDTVVDKGLCSLTSRFRVHYERKSRSPPICIVIGDPNYTLGNETSYKTVFFPLVDEFSLFQLANSVSCNATGDANCDWDPADSTTRLAPQQFMRNRDLRVRIEVPKSRQLPYYIRYENVVSPWAQMYKTPKSTEDGVLPVERTFIVPFMTAVIELDHGVPVKVFWDEGCYGCSPEECISTRKDNTDEDATTTPRNCGVRYDQCKGYGGDVDCDLKIYVAWYGTDAKGSYLTSSNMRLSAFRKYSFKDAFDSARRGAEEQFPNFDPRFEIGD